MATLLLKRYLSLQLPPADINKKSCKYSRLHYAIYVMLLIMFLFLRLGGIFDDIRGQIQNQHKWAASQLERLSEEQTQHIQQQLNNLREKMVSGIN